VFKTLTKEMTVV